MAELTAQNVQNMLNQQTMQNNAWSAEQAQKQMDFQEHMSNTAYQRQVADLKAAGLNPALVYGNGGSGAATSAGAMANADTSGNAALVSFLGNLLNTQNEIKLQENNAKLQRELTEKNNSLTAMIAELNRQVSLQTSYQAAEATRAAASMSAAAVQYSAQQSNEAAHYTSDVGYKKQVQADEAAYKRLLTQGVIDETLNNAKYAHDAFMARNYPTTMYQAVGSAATNLGLDELGENAYHEVMNGVFNALGKSGIASGSQVRNAKRVANRYKEENSWKNR